METERKVVRIRLDKTWTGDTLTLTFMGYDIEGKRVGPVAGVEPIVTDFSHMSAENNKRAWQHGLEQKTGDAAAILKDKKSGRSASVAEKRSAIVEVAERLAKPDGDWNLKGGRGPVDSDSLLAKLTALGYDVSKVSKAPVDVTPEE